MESTFEEEEKLFSNDIKDEFWVYEEEETQLVKESDKKPFIKEEVKEEVEDEEMWRYGGCATGEKPGVDENLASKKRECTPKAEALCGFYGDDGHFGLEQRLQHSQKSASGDGAAEREQKEGQMVDQEDSVTIRYSQRSASAGEAAYEEEDDDEMEETVDKDGSVDDRNGEKKCPVEGCAETFIFSKDLVNHMKKHPKPLLCGVCKRSCPSGCHLRRHYMIHTGEKPFKCDTCQKTFSQESKLVSHRRTHTGERPYACDSCGYTASDHNTMKRHRLIHTGEKPHKCTVCDKNFTQAVSLTRHMVIHTGERPFECDMCEYKTTRMFSLKRHKLRGSHTNSEEKIHSCTMCDKHFPKSSSLTWHMRAHRDEHPYTCDICEYKASYSSQLKAHKRIHTREELFTCTCGYKAASTSVLTRHKNSFSH